MPHHDVGFETVLGDVDGEVAAGVAGPHDEHTVAFDIPDVPVAAGMNLLAREGARNVGHLGVPQVSVGDQHAVVGAGAAGGRDVPPRRSGGPSVSTGVTDRTSVSNEIRLSCPRARA